MQTYLVIVFIGIGFILGFLSTAILIVPRMTPQFKNVDEYIRESLKPFWYLFGKDIKDMQALYDACADVVDELKDYKTNG